jgi:alkylhydroperoxidase family enzyme
MTRLVPLQAPYPEPIQRQFDAIMPPGVAPLGLFRTLAGHERAWRKFRAGSLLDDGPLSLRQREIVINRTCARAGCEYEWGVHVALFADAAGLTGEEVSATTEVPARHGGWSPAEAALIATVDALHERAGLTPEEFARLGAHFGGGEVLEVLMLAGFYRTVAYLANGLDLPLEDFAARFPDHDPGDTAPSAE